MSNGKEEKNLVPRGGLSCRLVDTYMGEREDKIVSPEKILSYFKDNSSHLYKEYVEGKLMNREILDKMEMHIYPA